MSNADQDTEQTYQALVRDHLTVLGLVSRLEGAAVAGDDEPVRNFVCRGIVR